MLENINTLITEYRTQVETMRNNLKQELLKMFKELFASTPEIKAIMWVQYTPYFNDGEPCTFSVNEPSFTNAEGDDLDLAGRWEYTGENDQVWVYDGYGFDTPKNTNPTHLVPLFKEVTKLLTSSTMKDILLTSFGDHAEVTVTAETIKVSEYEHD